MILIKVIHQGLKKFLAYDVKIGKFKTFTCADIEEKNWSYQDVAIVKQYPTDFDFFGLEPWQNPIHFGLVPKYLELSDKNCNSDWEAYE